jgi:DSF synthase
MGMLMTGEELSAEVFAQRGGLEAVVDDGTGERWVREYARETLSMHSARLALFVAFHARQGDMRAELDYQGRLWVDSMMRLAPMEISRLQRVVQAQDRLLLRTYKKLQRADAVPH